MNILIVFFLVLIVTFSANGLAIDEEELRNGKLSTYQTCSKEQLEVAINTTQVAIQRTKEAMSEFKTQLDVTDLEEGMRAAFTRRLADTYETAFESYEFLGNRLFELGETQEALDAYHEAIEYARLAECLIPARFYHNLGATYITLGRYGEGIERYKLAIETQGNQCLSATYFALAKVYEFLKNNKDAESTFKEGVRMVTGEDKAFLYYEKAMFLNRRNEIEKEINALQSALEFMHENSPLRASCLFALGTAYLDQDDSKHAAKYLQMALNAKMLDESDTAVAYYELGVLNYNLRDYTSAKKFLTQAANYPELEEDKYQKAREIIDQVKNRTTRKKGHNNARNGLSVANGVSEQTKADIRKRAISFMSNRQNGNQMGLDTVVDLISPEFPNVKREAITVIVEQLVSRSKNGKRKK